MYVANWMHFTDTYRGTFQGYNCTVIAERAEGTRLLIALDNAEFATLDVAADHVGEFHTPSFDTLPVPTTA